MKRFTLIFIFLAQVIVQAQTAGFEIQSSAHLQYRVTETVAFGKPKLVTFTSDSSTNQKDVIQLKWKLPATNIAAVWTPEKCSGIGPDWGSNTIKSVLTKWAPVISLYALPQTNVYTLACSQTSEPVELRVGLREETGYLIFKAKVVPNTGSNGKKTFQLYIDERALDLTEALSAVSNWWEQAQAMKPLRAPEQAYQPFYSTWYSMHQHTNRKEVLEQARAAKNIGIQSIIIDDGWQTLDTNRGYRFCGEWKPERIGDVRSFSDSLHAMGMKVMFWFSVPYVGNRSPVYPRFKNKLLFVNKSDSSVGTLDPRFPEVRSYLIDIYKKAIQEWDLDGLKLDFVDNFVLLKEDQWSVALNYTEEAIDGRDIASVYTAVDVLMKAIRFELSKIKPDILLEFRQSYIGPQMRLYGNLFRVGDCPYSLQDNRVGTANLRLLSGNTAVHADPLMWGPKETPQQAARQLVHALFGVPQHSYNIRTLGNEHIKMLSFWNQFISDHSDLLYRSRFKAYSPHLNYPLLEVSNQTERLVGVYTEDKLLSIQNGFKTQYFVNGTGTEQFHFRSNAKKTLQFHVIDCFGKIVQRGSLLQGTHLQITVPISGLVRFD